LGRLKLLQSLLGAVATSAGGVASGAVLGGCCTQIARPLRLQQNSGLESKIKKKTIFSSKKKDY
jgi:hypothetical protein